MFQTKKKPKIGVKGASSRAGKNGGWHDLVENKGEVREKGVAY
jgi:hypothetical protein